MNPFLKNLKKNIPATFAKDKESSTHGMNNNWYMERYQSVIVQRNLIFLLIVISLFAIIISIFTILRVSTAKTVEPFVVEIEEKTGIPTVIRPFIPDQFTVQYTYDESLRIYFLLKYLRAREEYNFHTYNYDYFTVTRSLSNKDVYAQFRSNLYSSNTQSPLLYGQSGKVSLTIRSIKHLPPSSGEGYLVQIVFIKNLSSETKNTSENKVATIGYNYFDLSMNNEEREINPLGFQITSYRVDDYTL